jgi:hypothetical protein
MDGFGFWARAEGTSGVKANELDAMKTQRVKIGEQTRSLWVEIIPLQACDPHCYATLS